MRRIPADAITSEDVLHDAENFSLVLGGPMYQLLRRSHLSDDTLSHVRWRVVVAMAVTWLPLLVLSAFQGQLFDNAAVPFLHDLELHVRFLLAVPLLILSELVVHERLRPIVRTFLDRNLVASDALERFDDAIRSGLRLRNSMLAEVLLLGFVYLIGVTVVWRHYIALDAATWYGAPGAGGTRLTPAGWWFGYVSLPVFQFLLMRWYFRMFIWTRFLWHVSRIPLQLVPTHPDRVGGLGFLGNTVFAFMTLALAHGVMLAGPLASRILFLGAKLPQFKLEILVVVVFVMLLVFSPLLVFARQLSMAKRAGLREYGTLSERYVRGFDQKWLRGGAPPDEPLLGSSDIQSLADMGGSFEVVAGMRLAPITRPAIMQLGMAVLLPVAPLLLTIMPLDQLISQLAGVLL